MRTYTEDIIVPIDTYKMHVTVEYRPATEPLLLAVSFEPEMHVVDMEFDCDIVVHSSDKNIGDICMNYWPNAHVGGWWLQEETDKLI